MTSQWLNSETTKIKKVKKTKAKAILFATVSPSIMTLESANAIWNYLRDEYQGNQRIKAMKVLNLIKEFEVLKIKESETIKEYSDQLLKIANQVRLLGTKLSDSRIVQKLLVTIS